jgi:DNA-binding transcriptional ArsR family regulator
MENYLDAAGGERMSRVFAALADPTRRAVLEQLEEGPRTVSDLARPLTIQMPTVLKHLGVLDDAGLVRREKKGRVVTVSLVPEPLSEALAWLQRYERFWADRLDRLGRFLDEDSKGGKK